LTDHHPGTAVLLPLFKPDREGVTSMGKLAKGTKVEWKWGANTAEGTVKESFEKSVQRTIKGTKVKRNASKEEPAYLVEQEDGGRALKSESELHKE
jgi:hypothetical protein